MSTYLVQIGFIIEIEAENKEEAEERGYDWWPRYPDYLNGDFIQPDTVEVLREQ
jgi:hypothetical protein